MLRQAPKAALYDQFARIGMALSSPVRLELLELLDQGERSVDQLATAANMRVSNTSAQLQRLGLAGLVTKRRDGSRVYYRLAGDSVSVFVERAKDLARELLAEADRAATDYLGDVAALEPVSVHELARRIRAGDVIVLDVRPADEYAAGHIPGALNVPHDELADRLAGLPADGDIIAYCRGRYCVFAPEAARVLRAHHRSARVLDGGLPDWRHAGLPVDAGPAQAPRSAPGRRVRTRPGRRPRP